MISDHRHSCLHSTEEGGEALGKALKNGKGCSKPHKVRPSHGEALACARTEKSPEHRERIGPELLFSAVTREHPLQMLDYRLCVWPRELGELHVIFRDPSRKPLIPQCGPEAPKPCPAPGAAVEVGKHGLSFQ